jgi:hypothetical protein
MTHEEDQANTGLNPPFPKATRTGEASSGIFGAIHGLLVPVPIPEIAHHQTQTGAFPWEVFLSNP